MAAIPTPEAKYRIVMINRGTDKGRYAVEEWINGDWAYWVEDIYDDISAAEEGVANKIEKNKEPAVMTVYDRNGNRIWASEQVRNSSFK